MAAKLIELRDQVIIDANIMGDPKFPTPRLNRMIALAERYVQTELNQLGIKKWEKSLTITKTGGTADGIQDGAFNSASDNVGLIDIPFVDPDTSAVFLNDLLETPSSILFADCDYLYTATHSYGLAYEVDKDKFKESLVNSYLAPTKLNPIFMRLNNKIWVAPLSDGSYNLTQIILYYYKIITDITTIISPATDADQNTTEIPVEFEEYIVKKVRLEIDSLLNRVQNKQLLSNQLQKEISDAYQKFIGKQTELNRANQQSKKSLQ